MGVPAFFRWLCRKYPSVVVYCVEEKKKEIDGVEYPVDSSQPNPNGVEFDNLYLDMNGIIHPCTHPEDKPAPKNEDEMMIAIFQAIDRLFAIVRPRKLLYMAIDGVAPRAKMNQQRSRRFRASKESFEKVEEISRIRNELMLKGVVLPPEKPKEDHFDSNCITPGTEFMDRLSKCLHYYIHKRLNNDPGWRNIKVILSDANVPGEGEHKIMDFIRRQRAQPDHDPNTEHCLCGADADLIMLGLATHEPHFTIIREEFRPNKPRPCEICNQLGHEMKDCVGCQKPSDGVPEQQGGSEEIPYIFVRLSVLREYLEKDLNMPNLPFPYDFERVVDDWVFMCFFVGNDFLPHLPSLEIREGAIDRLVDLYKNCVYKTEGFLTESGTVNLNCVQIILNELGKVEDEIFKRRQQTELMFKQREKNKKKMAMQNRDGRPAWIMGGQYTPTAPGKGPTVVTEPRQEACRGRLQTSGRNVAIESLLQAETFSEDQDQDQWLTVDNDIAGNKRELQDSSDEEVNDEVRLWEDGFKDRYYESKFDVGSGNIEFRTRVAHEYVRGLCWVLKYYYQGCASWKWFFPYHYAPFASDFINITNVDTNFEKGTKPFKPLEQLMGVFPAASSSHIPRPWAELMHDPSSPIIDFYPLDFKIDLNGKKFAWQGVALLPFVDEKRLIKALEPYYEHLTPAERKRNIRGDDRVYIGPGNQGYTFLKGLYEDIKTEDDELEFLVDGMRGTVLPSNQCIDLEGILVSPIRSLPTVRENIVICARFRDPTYSADFIFVSRRLQGAVDPVKVLRPGFLSTEQGRNWRPQIGFSQRSSRASLDQSGHRTLQFYNRSFQRQNSGESGPRFQRGVYSQVPPPSTQSHLPSYNTSQPFQSYGYRTAQGNSGQGHPNRGHDQRFRGNRGGGGYRGFSGNHDRHYNDYDSRGSYRGNRGFESQRQGSHDQRRQGNRNDHNSDRNYDRNPDRNFERNPDRNYDRNPDRNHDRNYERNQDRNYERNQDRNYDRNHDRNHDRNYDRNYERNQDRNYERSYDRTNGNYNRGRGMNQYGRGYNRGGHRGHK